MFFHPDPEIFKETTVFQSDRISQRLRELAFLNSGLEITFIDERPAAPKPEMYYYRDGIEEFVNRKLHKIPGIRDTYTLMAYRLFVPERDEKTDETDFRKRRGS